MESLRSRRDLRVWEMSSLYIGTGAGKIYHSSFDPRARVFSPARVASDQGNSFFLARHPCAPILYSLDEAAGTLVSFRMESGGALTPLNRVSSQGKVPCHLEVDREGRYLVLVNYLGGVALFPLERNGSVKEAASILQLSGEKGPSPRQDASHPHGIALHPELNLIYVADLGYDQVSVLRVDPDKWTWQPVDELTTKVAPGAGPRHLSFLPGGRALLAVNELDSTITYMEHEPRKGRLAVVGTVSMLPAGFTGESWAAELICHPNGKRCYATNRGHDSIVSVSIPGDTKTKFGTPSWIEGEGKRPEHLAFNQAATHLFVANSDSDAVVVHALGQEGALGCGPKDALSIPKPMCVLPF